MQIYFKLDATPYLLAYVVRVRCRSTLKMFITSRGRAYALFKRCIDRMHYDKGCQRLLKYSTMLGHIDHRLTFSKSITRNKGKEKLKHLFIFFIHQFLGQQVVKF